MNRERLMEYTLRYPPTPITDEQIAAFEAKAHLRLPSDFKRFLKKWNGGDFACQDEFRICDFTDPSDIIDLGKDVLQYYIDEEDFPDVDPNSVDVLYFGDDGSEGWFYLMIDKKDPERYWLFEANEGSLASCVDSVSAFLDKRLANKDLDAFYFDMRTWKQKLADSLYGERPRSLGGRVIPDDPCGVKDPSVQIAGHLDDAPPDDSLPKLKSDVPCFGAILPGNELLPMTRVQADADGSRPFWISYYPVPNDQFVPLNRLDDSLSDGNAQVSVEDAELFCAILTDFFAKSLPDGYAFALPSDAEYRRALKHAEQTAEKPKTGVFRSLLKLFVRPNPGPEHLTEILKRNTIPGSGESKKLPFYIVLTPDRVNPRDQGKNA